MSKLSNLVFFGSGPVAAASLEGLMGAGFKIEGVVTKPKPPHHRGSFPVLEIATRHNLDIYPTSDKQDLVKLFKNHSFSSSCGLVVDYGIIIPKEVIDTFPKGIINSHFSLLPQWRGADPITFSILSGQEQTGVSLMLIEPTLDTGQLLAQADYKMTPDEDIISLTRNLTELSNKTLCEILPLYLDGKIALAQQNPDQKPTYSRRLTKDDGKINWDKSAEELEREVRAFRGWPKSQANTFGHNIIITKARIAKSQEDGKLVERCNPGFLEIQELIGPSGRTMSGADFLRGYSKN